MKHAKTNFVLLVVAVMTLFLASVGLAATNTAANASLAAVQAAVNVAVPGDTVLVPPGSATWAGTLIVQKSINLIGAGTNATFITNGTANTLSFLIIVALTNGTAFHISGFYFDCNWTDGGGGIDIVAKVYQPFYNDVSGFRIDHCVFARCFYNYGAPANRPIQCSGRIWGVVDHCQFTDNVISISTEGCPWYPSTYPSGPNGDLDWSYMPAPYYYLASTNNLVVEDCQFNTTPSMGSPGVFILMDSRWTAHYVVRYCTISDPARKIGDCFDVHGNQDARGAICTEIYNNNFNMSSSMWRLIHLRGGTCMVFSNTVVGAGSANVEINEEETYRTDLSGPTYGPVNLDYPKHDQVTNSFFWANTLDGVSYGPSENAGMQAVAPNWFQEGRDYWNHAPNNTNVLKDYAPLVYPHPLVTAQDSVTNRPVISNPELTGTTFTLSVPTQLNVNYVLEFKNFLTDAVWTSLQTNSGNGGMMNLTNTETVGSSRFFRIRIQ